MPPVQHTFEHLLGLSTQTAISILAASSIFDVDVVLTSAPPRKNPSPQDELRSDAGELNGYASTRVMAVQDDGRKLIVSRFLVGEPKRIKEEAER